MKNNTLVYKIKIIIIAFLLVVLAVSISFFIGREKNVFATEINVLQNEISTDADPKNPDEDYEYSIFGKTITSREAELVVMYPVQAAKAFFASEDADKKVAFFYNTDAWQDNADAFRHAYWNALMTKRISKFYTIPTGTPEFPSSITVEIDFAKLFADAHETDPDNIGVDKEMDLRNNALGREMAETYSELSEEELAYKIMESISYGNFWQIKNGQLVPTNGEGLLPEYFDELMFETTAVDSNKVCIDKVNWSIEGAYTIPSTIKGNTVTEIGSNAFQNQTELTEVVLNDNILVIKPNAFENCTNLTTITETSNLQSIGTEAFKGCTSLTSINIPAGVTSIGAGAFSGCNNLNITVDSSNPNYSAQGNILYNKTQTEIITTGDISANITIPETVTKVGAKSFYNNDNLEKLYFEALPLIEDFAFFDCENLAEVYFYSYTTPTLGASAFAYDDFTLYVPHSKQSEYVNTFAGYVNTASSIPIIISFSSDGTVIETLNTYYGATITGLINPSKTGYNFVGYYDNSDYTGTVYINGGLWDTTDDMTVYAKWAPQTYYIYFTGYGSENLADKEVTYNALIGTMPAISRTGYTFYGWKNQYNEYFTSDTVWQKLSNQTVFPDLRANQYTITYNGNGGMVNAESQAVYYDSVISSFATAYRNGYTFTGWNTASDGSGQTITAPYVYETDGDITLYAQYTANEYNVTFDKQGGTGGSDGVNTIYNSPMPSGTDITAPTRTGYSFQGYYRYANGVGTKYYNANMTSANNWNLLDDTILFAHWTANEYTVTLDQQGGTGGSEQVNATYNNDMPSGSDIIAPTRTGYSFQGYFEYAGGEGTKYYNSDMTSHNVWDMAEDSTIYADWTPNTYNISLQLEGGVNGSTIVQATYNMPMNFTTAPTRVGYTFQGYYSLPDGDGTKYYNSDMSSAHVWDIADNGTLYAYWIGNSYAVTFDKQKGSGGTESTDVVYGSAMPEGLSAPTRTNYVFVGYFDGTTDDSTMYYNGNMESVQNWDKLTDATLYAHWRGEYFSIIYHNLTFLNKTADVIWDDTLYNDAPTYYEYGVGLDLTRVSAFWQSDGPYSPHLRFLGWYEDSALTTEVTNISPSETGSVVLYAKWRYDYSNGGRLGEIQVTNADPKTQYRDQIAILLELNDLKDELLSIGITKVHIKFKINMWSLHNHGEQFLYFYADPNGTQLLHEEMFEVHASAEQNPPLEEAVVKEINFTVDLEDLDTNYIYVMYKASTSGTWFWATSDTWVNDEIYYEIMYIKDESDIDAPEFYWSYQDPF